MYNLNARDHFNCSPLLFSWPAPRNRCGQTGSHYSGSEGPPLATGSASCRLQVSLAGLQVAARLGAAVPCWRFSVRVVNEKERERRAPKARESRRRGGGWGAAGARIEAPKASRGWGVGCPPPHRERRLGRACALSPETFFWFWLSIWWVLVHSGWYFLQFSYLFYMQNHYMRIKAVMVSRWDSVRPWSLHSLRTLRLGWTKMCSFII